jgi:hypothetical protein
MIDVSKQVEPDAVGEEHGGKWIAWDHANIHIIATGVTADEARRNAEAAGVRDPILEFVPPADAAFMGGV